MNTASRMESTSLPNHIQVSQETADLLKMGGKGLWLVPREGKVTAKGKGDLNTFFLRVLGEKTICNGSSDTHSTGTGEDSPCHGTNPQEPPEKRARQAKWATEVLSASLREIEAKRQALEIKRDTEDAMEQLEKAGSYNLPINEVEEIIVLPEYDRNIEEYHDSDLDDDVMEQLAQYVQTIQCLYKDNLFHNFQHANHVLMSVNKLLSRIVAPDIDDVSEKKLHDHTYGICSDPLTRFSVLFSALIHDCDHAGVPNAQLVKEGIPMVKLYDGKAVLEQNSLDIAWDLLLEPSFKKLRQGIVLFGVPKSELFNHNILTFVSFQKLSMPTALSSRGSASLLSIVSWPLTLWTRI
jgi:3'5'-cyclic nucleotide phosphodiesterase/Adenylate and Guanylate cyclase catalytic domain